MLKFDASYKQILSEMGRDENGMKLVKGLDLEKEEATTDTIFTEKDFMKKKELARAYLNNLIAKDTIPNHLKALDKCQNNDAIDALVFSISMKGKGLGVYNPGRNRYNY